MLESKAPIARSAPLPRRGSRHHCRARNVGGAYQIQLLRRSSGQGTKSLPIGSPGRRVHPSFPHPAPLVVVLLKSSIRASSSSFLCDGPCYGRVSHAPLLGNSPGTFALGEALASNAPLQLGQLGL